MAGFAITIPAPNDSETGRRTEGRLATLAVLTASTISVPIGGAVFVGSYLHPIFQFLATVGGVVAAGGLTSGLLRTSLVYNPEWRGYLTNNPFKGRDPGGGNIAYGPGVHVAYPWEQRNKKGTYPLDVTTTTQQVTVSTKTAKVVVTYSYGWAISLENINQFVGTGPATVHTIFTGFIDSFLIAQYAGKTAERVRSSITETNELLEQTFIAQPATGGQTLPTRLGQEAGVIPSLLVIKSIALADQAQATRDAIDESAQYSKAIAALLGITPAELKRRLGDGRLAHEDYMELLNRVMATSDNATMQLQVFEARGIAAAITNALGNLLGIGGRRG